MDILGGMHFLWLIPCMCVVRENIFRLSGHTKVGANWWTTHWAVYISLFLLPLGTSISVDACGRKTAGLGLTCARAVRTAVRTSKTVQYSPSYENFAVFTTFE
jgi:hypothetical protein